MVFLSGCASENGSLDHAMSFRKKLLAANGCSFRVKLYADYGDSIYSFTMDCVADAMGDLDFSVEEPETIQGICGKISETGGNLTFDGMMLAIPKLADEQLTPISAPWVLLHSLRSGYIQSAGTTERGHLIRLEDSYCEDPLTVDVYTDRDGLPASAEILWRGKRILSMEIGQFTFA